MYAVLKTACCADKGETRGKQARAMGLLTGEISKTELLMGGTIKDKARGVNKGAREGANKGEVNWSY